MKTKTKTKTILIIIVVLIGIFLYDQHKQSVRVNYAQANDCTWTIQGSHDICK